MANSTTTPHSSPLRDVNIVGVSGAPISGSNPIPVSGSFTGSSASVGLTGATAPTSADEIGWVDGSGNLTNVKTATPLPVVQTGTPALPTGASTSAKQPALGTAGTASTDVLTIQGIASMTKLLVTPDSVALPANQSVNVAQVNGVTTSTGTGAVGTGTARVAVGTDTATVAGSVPGTAGSPSVFVGVSGAAASGATVVGNPVLEGGRAATTNPTAVSDGQAVAVMLTKSGKTVIVDGAPRELKGTQKATLSNTTSETTIITAGGSGVFDDVYGLVLANTGATTTKVDIRDATAGTIIMTFEVPTLETRGFMVSAGSAVSQTTANNNWTAQCAAATTAMEITAFFVKTT